MACILGSDLLRHGVRRLELRLRGSRLGHEVDRGSPIALRGIFWLGLRHGTSRITVNFESAAFEMTRNVGRRTPEVRSGSQTLGETAVVLSNNWSQSDVGFLVRYMFGSLVVVLLKFPAPLVIFPWRGVLALAREPQRPDFRQSYERDQRFPKPEICLPQSAS